MFQRFLTVLALACLISGVGLAAGAQTPPPASVFAAPPPFHDISLSPSGQQIAMIVQRDNLFYIEVWNVGADAPSASYDFGPARAPNWIRWKNEERLLVSVGVPTDRFDFLLNETRLVSFSNRLTNPVMVSQLSRRRRWDPPFQDNIVHILPDDERSILLQINFVDAVHPTLYRADVHTGRLSEVRRGNVEVSRWLAGPDGNVVVGLGDPFRNRAPVYRVRPNDWIVDAVAIPGGAFEGQVFQPAGFDGSPNRMVVRSNHEGGTTGLYVFDLDSGAFVQTLFQDDAYDVLGPIMSPDGQRVVGAGYIADVYHVEYFDPAARERMSAVQAMVGRPELWIADQTRDGRYLIAVEYVHGRPGATFWVDTASSIVRPVGRGEDPLADQAAGQVIAVSYVARDGVTIPAYVTLPPGITRDAAVGLPFVVMPHGGPHSRDTADFDFLAQFIASRGYGVLQPNFRGSTGYGEAFRQAGEREWGGAILDDVEDGTRWLLSEGLADPTRMCVVGWSFGGYLAMMSAVEHGDLFQCASAVAPVTDLPDLIDHQEQFYGGDQVMRRMIGGAWRDRSRLVNESPARRADGIAMPLLIAHGTIDDVVPISQSEKMVKAVQRAGKPVEFLSIDWADHSLSREGDRLRYLQRLEVFLNTHIGPGVAEPASQPVPGS